MGRRKMSNSQTRTIQTVEQATAVRTLQESAFLAPTTNLLSSSSFSEACKVETSGNVSKLQTTSATTRTSPSPRGGIHTLDAAVSLASMRQDHKNDPPLPTDVIQRIFEPVATTIETASSTTDTCTSTAATVSPMVVVVPPIISMPSQPLAVTSDLEFNTALDMLAMCKAEDDSKLSEEDLAVPISPSHSQQNKMQTPAKPTLSNNKKIQNKKSSSSDSSSNSNSSAKRKIPLTSKNQNVKRPKMPTQTPTASFKRPKVTKEPTVNAAAATAAHQHQSTQPVVLRTDIDPQDGSPTVVRTDGGVMRELKEHKFPHRNLNKQGKPMTLHDEILEDGLLVATKEDLDSYPTERQKKAFRTFIHRVNELRQYTQHYGDCTFMPLFCTSKYL
jgi:hypothetical protein